MLENTALVAPRSPTDGASARRRRKRIDGRYKPARRAKELAQTFRERLGPAAPGAELQIRECAELVVVAEEMRAAMLRGEPISADAMLKAQGYATRALRRLGLVQRDGQQRPFHRALQL